MGFSVEKRLSNHVQRLSPNRTHGPGQCRFVGPRIPRRYVGIHWLFLCKFFLRWWTQPSRSIASARAEGSRANVASWAHESRECAWAFSGFSSVSSPSAGGASPHSLVPALPDLFPKGMVFFRRKAFEPTTYSVFRQVEPTARADVASWAHESCECTWRSLAFSTCFTFPFTSLRPRSGFGGQMSPRKLTNPANLRGHPLALPL